MSSEAVRRLRNARNMIRKMAAIENSDRTVMRRVAARPLSNWPAYRT